MSKNLHLIPKLPLGKDQKYDAGMGCLTLAKAGIFTVDITKRDGLHKGAPEKLAPFKRLTQEEVFAMPNVDDRKVYVKDHKERDKKEAEYNKERDDFNKKLHEELGTLSWCWETVGNGMEGKTMSSNDDFVKGLPKDGEKQITFPEILEGGGLAWLEVFTKNDPATGKVPNGLFVRAVGIPEIKRVEWTDLDCKPITGKVKFGSKVLLNIYTRGLYGQDLEIGLWDKDTADPDDLLSISNKGHFTSEALVFKVLPNEINKEGVSGGIKINGKSESHVQKVRIPVLVETKWMFSAGNELKIYPTVKSKETGMFLKIPSKCFLEVSLDGVLHETVIEKTNNPLLVGKVETNVASFKPCRYDKIELKTQNKAGSTVLFDSSNNEQRSKKSTTVEIVAGKKETYLLDFDLHTLECENKPKHTTKEITILTIPKDYELKIDPSSKAEHKIKKEEKELVKSESSRNSSIMGTKTTQKETVATEKGVVTVRQKQIEFDTFYNYDIPQDANAATTFYKAMKYFWLPNLSVDKIHNITAVANSCAFQQNINIAIYPDIKWTLKFGFNVEKDDIEKLNRKGGTFAPLKTFEDKAEEKDKAYFEKHKKQKETLERAEKHFTDKYNLKPKATTAPVEKGTSFKQLLEILQRITISLEEQHYGGDVKNELTEDFVKQLYEQAKTVIDLAKIGVELLEGKHDQSNYTPEDDRNIDGLAKKLARKPVAYEFLYPKLSFAGSWFYEQIDAKQYPELAGRQGLGVDLMLNAAPLIGVTIKWDILELLCRRHPIAYTILKAVDALLYILADDSSAVKCDFSVTGQIDTTIDLQHNMLAGFKDFNVKGKSAIACKIEIELRLNNSVKFLGFEAYAKRGVLAGAGIGLGVEDTFGVDAVGIYTKKDLIFEGIKFYFEAEANAGLTKVGGKKKKSIINLGGKISGEITMLAHTFSTDKIYLNKILQS
jgi:hypothetical protein